MNVENPREFLDRRQLLSALRSFRKGDFTVRLPEDSDDVDQEVADRAVGHLDRRAIRELGPAQAPEAVAPD